MNVADSRGRFVKTAVTTLTGRMTAAFAGNRALKAFRNRLRLIHNAEPRPDTTEFLIVLARAWTGAGPGR